MIYDTCCQLAWFAVSYFNMKIPAGWTWEPAGEHDKVYNHLTWFCIRSVCSLFCNPFMFILSLELLPCGCWQHCWHCWGKMYVVYHRFLGQEPHWAHQSTMPAGPPPEPWWLTQIDAWENRVELTRLECIMVHIIQTIQEIYKYTDTYAITYIYVYIYIYVYMYIYIYMYCIISVCFCIYVYIYIYIYIYI